MQVILEVAIGLVLTIAVTAVVVSSTMELISAFVRMRARYLEQGIARLLDDSARDPRDGVLGRIGLRKPSGNPTPLTDDVLAHPLIKSLSSARASGRPPSYIDAVTFATALLETSLGSASLLARMVGDADAVSKAVAALGPGEPGDTIRAAATSAGSDPVQMMTLLIADTTDGPAAIAALIGTDANAVDVRINQLSADNDLAAPALRQAWTDANRDIPTFITNINTPPLIATADQSVTDISNAIQAIKARNVFLGKSLEALWNRAGHDFGTFRHEVEDWFDREMARVSGWYGRWAQWSMVAVALVIVAALNISAVTVGKSLWLDPTLRSEVVSSAQSIVDATTTTTTTAVAGQTPATAAPAPVPVPATEVDTSSLESIGLPIGWSATAWPGWEWYLPLHIFGMVMVAIAASFGAPFWFDLLNRLVNLRTTGRPPATAAQQRADAAT